MQAVYTRRSGTDILASKMNRRLLFAISFGILAMNVHAQTDWKPAPVPVSTPFAAKVKPENPLPDYPRPALVRSRWLSLNGLWDFAAKTKPEDAPKIKSKILVPFPVESSLSGVGYMVQPSDVLIYTREFTVPKAWKGDRTLLHFDAVDWGCRVYVNDRFVGSHEGGYDRFSFDVSDFLVGTGPQKLRVEANDPGNTGGQPNGKQVLKPQSIWYTGTSGIWQTVWLEPVKPTHIRSYKVETQIDGTVRLIFNVQGQIADTKVNISIGGTKVSAEAIAKSGTSNPLIFEAKIPNPKLWSPKTPYLYSFTANIELGDQKIDSIKGYFGIREIKIGKDAQGINRLMLNGQPTFMFGPLDQGFNPDGLHTWPTEEAMLFDLKSIKRYGCNMLRKHIKVEPDRYYYACDKMGLLVWQDMPSMSEQPFLNKPAFESELSRMIETHWNYPSIVVWVPFNEGWGQYDTERITAFVRRKDPSRIIDNPSGWTDKGVGDVHDIHEYPGPGVPDLEANRAAVLGEFGGLGLPVEGHTWLEKGNWGYVQYKSKEELTAAYISLLDNTAALIPLGLCAAVYTQTTDVEVETNGWLTYDRKVAKIDMKKAAAAAKRLYDTKGKVEFIVQPASVNGADSRFTVTKPEPNWMLPEFNAGAWAIGKGRYTDADIKTPHTQWKTPDIWVRREFTLNSIPKDPSFLLLHDDDVEVYINGVLAFKRTGYVNNFVVRPMLPEGIKALRKGKNVIAIHCNSVRGGQHVDVGIIDKK